MSAVCRAGVFGATVLSMALQGEAASIQAIPAIAVGCSLSGVYCTPAVYQVGTTDAIASVNTTDSTFHYYGTAHAFVLGGGSYLGSSNSLTIDPLQPVQRSAGILSAQSIASASDSIFLYVPSGAGTIVFDFSLLLNGGQNGGVTVTVDGNSYFGFQSGTHSMSVPFTNGVAIPSNVSVQTATTALLEQGVDLSAEDSSGLFSLYRIQVLDQMNNPVPQYGYRTASGLNPGFDGTAVPEPSTMLLLLSGAAALLLKRNSRSRRQEPLSSTRTTSRTTYDVRRNTSRTTYDVRRTTSRT